MNQVPNVKQYWRAVCKNALLCVAAMSCCLLSTRHAAADVVIGEADGWEAYVNGQVDAFLSYAFGDAYPVPPIDPATGMPLLTGRRVSSSSAPSCAALAQMGTIPGGCSEGSRGR